MKQISKNFALGEEITDVREIKRLATERRSIARKVGFLSSTTGFDIKPAAIFLGWTLRTLLNSKLYYTHRIEKQ